MKGSNVLAEVQKAMGNASKGHEKDIDFVNLFYWPLYDSVRDDPDFIQISIQIFRWFRMVPNLHI